MTIQSISNRHLHLNPSSRLSTDVHHLRLHSTKARIATQKGTIHHLPHPHGQRASHSFVGRVREACTAKIQDLWCHPNFVIGIQDTRPKVQGLFHRDLQPSVQLVGTTNQRTRRNRKTQLEKMKCHPRCHCWDYRQRRKGKSM